jgi:hypothetical protein
MFGWLEESVPRGLKPGLGWGLGVWAEAHTYRPVAGRERNSWSLGLAFGNVFKTWRAGGRAWRLGVCEAEAGLGVLADTSETQIPFGNDNQRGKS